MRPWPRRRSLRARAPGPSTRAASPDRGGRLEHRLRLRQGSGRGARGHMTVGILRFCEMGKLIVRSPRSAGAPRRNEHRSAAIANTSRSVRLARGHPRWRPAGMGRRIGGSAGGSYFCKSSTRGGRASLGPFHASAGLEDSPRGRSARPIELVSMSNRRIRQGPTSQGALAWRCPGAVERRVAASVCEGRSPGEWPAGDAGGTA